MYIHFYNSLDELFSGQPVAKVESLDMRACVRALGSRPLSLTLVRERERKTLSPPQGEQPRQGHRNVPPRSQGGRPSLSTPHGDKNTPFPFVPLSACFTFLYFIRTVSSSTTPCDFAQNFHRNKSKLPRTNWIPISIDHKKLEATTTSNYINPNNHPSGDR